MLELAAITVHNQAIHMIPFLVESLVSLILPAFIIVTFFVVCIGMFFIGKFLLTKFFDLIDKYY